MAATAGIPPFDPVAPRGALFRALERFGRSRVGYQYGVRFASRFDPAVLRLTRGRAGLVPMLPSANLTTTGAKSGLPRTVAVLYFSDGEDVILVASSFGRERHPGWYHNLRANPEAVMEAGGRRGRYRATEVTDPEEHERLFALATRVYAGYADYRERTAGIGRRIPILRLSLIGSTEAP